jgi:HlyD family secretion protein
MKNSIILQRLKPLNRWTITLIVSGIAVTGGSLYYSISQFGQKPPEPVAPAPTIQPITALGRLEPASEVVRVAAPATLNNDRVAQLLVKRGDRVQVGQEIAILDSRDRLQMALLEAQERVRAAQAKLTQVKAGAKSGEIAAQQAEITRLQAGGVDSGNPGFCARICRFTWALRTHCPSDTTSGQNVARSSGTCAVFDACHVHCIRSDRNA